MNFDFVKDKTIIICENDYKKYILNYMSSKHIFLDIKFFTKKEFLQEYLFKYNEKTIYYLLEKYHYKLDIIRMYLDNLYYIDENKKYNNFKLQFLVSLKNELNSKGLLIYNNNFINEIKDYHLLLVGYSYLEKNELDIFNKLNVKIIENTNSYKHEFVYEFDTLEEEINYVLKSICNLISQGIDIKNIKIMGINEDYYNDLERIASFYDLNIKIPTNNYLYNNEITKKFLDGSNISLQKRLDNIKDENKEIVNLIINICNKYYFLEDEKYLLPLIIGDFKNTKIDNFKFENYLEIVDLDYPVNEEYIFLMNFNNNNIPKYEKDEKYLTDNIKDEVNLNKTVVINKLKKEYIINKINSIKNLVITYKLKSNKEDFYPSSLIKDLNLIVSKIDNNILESYSYLNDLINYTKLQDEYYLYNTLNDNYYIYQNSLDNNLYRSYNNSYKGIDGNLLKEYLHNKLTLSYTSLNNYNKCAFRYFVANILKLDKYEDTFEAFLGSLFHDVLEKCFHNNLNVFEEIENYINDSGRILTIKEKYYVNKIKKDIEFVIKVLTKQKEYTKLDKAYYEKNIVIDKSKDIKINFIGYIDKILYKELEDKTLVSIIDYKTGQVDIDLKYIPYGLSLQLPIYLYLVKKSNLFTNSKFVGFYLQYILDKDILRDNKTSYEEKKYDNLKLMGYSNCDISSLIEFDSTLQNSNLIKGMKIKNNGEFSSFSKVLSDIEIDNIIKLTEKNIDEAIDKILTSHFEINPKKIGYDNLIGCKYCKFKDICFKKEEDYLILDEIKDLSFLGGDEDAKMD